MSTGYNPHENDNGYGSGNPNHMNGAAYGEHTALSLTEIASRPASEPISASASSFPSNPEDSAAVDHALLESLFYNEMMMLDTSFPSSSNFLSQHFGGAVQPQQYHNQDPKTPMAETDAKIFAEKEMLQDFGVTESSQVFHSAPSVPPAYYAAPPVGPSIPMNVHVQVPQYTTNAPTNIHTHTYAYTHPHPQTSTNSHAPPPPSMHSLAPTHTPICPAPSQPQVIPTQAPLAPSPSAITTTSPLEPPPSTIKSEPTAKNEKSRVLTIETSKDILIPEEKARKLVDQFATLASRLGIELPTNVLQSLTAAAVKNDPKHQEMATKKMSTIEQNDDSSSDGKIEPSEKDSGSLDVAPTVEELRKTAEEAIAAVSGRKRATSDEVEDVDGGASGNNAAGNASSNNRPLYSKRRKKPRLSDCESRLAELKKENDLLKRHLQNVSNKALRFDQEKEEAGKRIKLLHDSNAGPEEMDKAVKEFTDMYSDYGVNRQQELSFHLEQLQRLVNPTNFTKLGLWTLGQQNSDPKRNPIAGILQKELDIVPQQGRKIVEQSEKIKALCQNLKECLSLLAKLRSLCEQKTQIFQDRMNKCREILTSRQVVKLIIWINEHTQLLESVCPGWGTEHIHSKPPAMLK